MWCLSFCNSFFKPLKHVCRRTRSRATHLRFESLEMRRVFAWWDSLSSEAGGTETASATRYLAADFTTDSAASALTAVLMLSQSGSANVEVELYSDGSTGLEPGSKLGTFTQVDTITSSLSGVEFTLQGVSLLANTDYWIVLRPTLGNVQWGWTSDFDVKNDWGSSDDAGATWYTTDVYPPQYSVSAGVTASLPQVSIADVTLDESAGTAQFVVSLSAASSQAVTVSYQTSDVTAQAGSDYTAKSGSLTIPAGSTSGVIVVIVNDDETDEANETFVVQLTSIANGTLLDASATATIVNDDSPHLWQNQRNPLDVNADGFVTALDALLIINQINQSASGALPTTTGSEPPPYYDCSGDDFLTPLDALLVINQLNSQPAAESEASAQTFVSAFGQDNRVKQ